MDRTRAAAIILAALALSPAARADMPYPANPMPCRGGATDPPCIDPRDFAYLFLPTANPPVRPDDFGADNWKLTSDRTGNPAIDGSAQELFGVKGASVDLAWQVTTGRPDVLIAVLDSGIQWQDRLTDVVNKFYLNRGELPVPEGNTNPRDAHDRNEDGLFNIRDYLADDTHPQDSRVDDRNGNDLIDPEDLIFRFSDGIDGDQNGYVDDISGWDFFEDDNDALDEVRYGHGTGESHDSGAEANNGQGDVGTCPNCLLLEVRVGDSFVTDVNLFAQGVTFAVDSGARVIQEALGTLNQSRFGQQAVDYAYRNGAVVVASAADEESYHHNYPASYNHTLEVNSVVKFSEVSGLRQSPPSYLYLNGCTNYGGHIALSVPSSSCSSEATGRGAGMAGLVVSAALNAIERGELTPYRRDDGSLAPFPLSAEEVKQILTSTADDINFDARPDLDPPLPQSYATSVPLPGVRRSRRFPSTAGWDPYFGYGRVNANAAVRRVRAGRIPPEAAIESPAWFAIIDPSRTMSLPISGRVAANRATSYRYTVEVAPGVQPAERDFVTAFASETRRQALDGVLATLDVAALRARMPRGVEGPAVLPDGSPDPDRFSFTVRVRVVDDLGSNGEDRRTLALHYDPDLLTPETTIGSDGTSSPVTADLDGDGKEEAIFGTSDGLVHALRWQPGGGQPAAGTGIPAELSGWPAATDPLELHADAPAYATGAVQVPVRGAVLGGVAVGDLERDGTLEVVATDMQGKLYVWNRDGSRRAGFPVSTIAEYSHSRRSERDLNTAGGRVPDLTNRHTTANRLGRAMAAGPVLANLDGSADGSLEILAAAFDRHIYAWRHTGEPLPGWPVLVKDPAKVAAVDPVTNEVTLTADANAAIGTKIVLPPSVGDLDGDGRLEVVAVANEEYREEPNLLITNLTLNLYRAAGAIEPGNTRVYAIDADGAAHGASGLQRGWNPDAFVAGWPVKTALITTELLPVVGTGSNGPPVLADVDGDGRLEVATMSAIGAAYVFTAKGTSFFGRHPSGQDRTVASDALGTESTSRDAPSLGALGAAVLAELAGPGQGFQLLAPASGLGKLIDAQLPAQQLPADNHLGIWEITGPQGETKTGRFVAAFPRVMNDLQFFGSPIVADIDGDGLPEALEGSGGYDIHAFNIQGAEPSGWPKFTNGWMVGSPAVGDLDGDGRLEVVGVTREGSLFVWRTTGDECGAIPWRRFHHDEWGSGNYHTDARPPASAAPAAITVLSATRARLTFMHLPGDDLFCGTAARHDLRFADAPIMDATAFGVAAPVATITGDVTGRRAGAEWVVEDPRFAGRRIHFALLVTDDANNHSAVIALGAGNFQLVTATPAAGSASARSSGCTMAAPDAAAPWPWASLTGVMVLLLSRVRMTSLQPPGNGDTR